MMVSLFVLLSVVGLSNQHLVEQSSLTNLFVIKIGVGTEIPPQVIPVGLDFNNRVSTLFSKSVSMAYVPSFNYKDSVSYKADSVISIDDVEYTKATDTLIMDNDVTINNFPFVYFHEVSNTKWIVPNDAGGVIGLSPSSYLAKKAFLVFAATHRGSFQFHSRLSNKLLSEVRYEDDNIFVVVNTLSKSSLIEKKIISLESWVLDLEYRPILSQAPQTAAVVHTGNQNGPPRYATVVDLSQKGVQVHRSIMREFLKTLFGDSFAQNVVVTQNGHVCIKMDAKYRARLDTTSGMRLMLGESSPRSIDFSVFETEPSHSSPGGRRLKYTRLDKGNDFSKRVDLVSTVIRIIDDDNKFQNTVIVGQIILPLLDAVVFSGYKSSNNDFGQIGFKFKGTRSITTASHNQFMGIKPLTTVPTFNLPKMVKNFKTKSLEMKFPVMFNGTGEWLLLSTGLRIDKQSGARKLSFIRNPHFGDFLPHKRVTPITGKYCLDSTQIERSNVALSVTIKLVTDTIIPLPAAETVCNEFVTVEIVRFRDSLEIFFVPFVDQKPSEASSDLGAMVADVKPQLVSTASSDLVHPYAPGNN